MARLMSLSFSADAADGAGMRRAAIAFDGCAPQFYAVWKKTAQCFSPLWMIIRLRWRRVMTARKGRWNWPRI